ncbi:glycosyltransferase family 4 protein [Coriobacteriia bacterium Es71-Z0120]|uniref:glycosyltransferase family 4 protein n=1 Tax=Parvivirga hydrogeniphila TaxID=2939460 RepID=UPI002260B4EE|nr:glycosyltransferase family 4 protein [Parvivirga hydrogeniphila]MCL4079342.1 glycosyltransferase family 4 protein [Parvivirga hydrogeniphila]
MHGSTRILLLNAFSGEGMGGGEVQTLYLVRGLSARGFEVHVACPPSLLADEARAAGAAVHERAFAARDLVVGHRAIRGVLARTGCQVVHGTGFLTNIVARRAKRAAAPVVVNTVHVMPDASLHESGSRVELAARRFVDRATLGRVDALVAVSGAVARALEQARLVPASGVRVIHNAIDIDDVVSRSTESVDGLPGGEGPLVGFLGRLERVKGPDLFVAACERLARRRADLRFAMAGSGTMGGEVSRRLRDTCAGRAVALQTVANPPAFVRALDVLVIPSRSEAFSLVALEAMAVGTPVVATEVGGLRDLIRESGAGVLVSPEDADALADAVERVLDDRMLAARLAQAGPPFAQQFAVDRLVDRYSELYRSLLSGEAP